MFPGMNNRRETCSSFVDWFEDDYQKYSSNNNHDHVAVIWYIRLRLPLEIQIYSRQSRSHPYVHSPLQSRTSPPFSFDFSALSPPIHHHSFDIRSLTTLITSHKYLTKRRKTTPILLAESSPFIACLACETERRHRSWQWSYLHLSHTSSGENWNIFQNYCEWVSLFVNLFFVSM